MGTDVMEGRFYLLELAEREHQRKGRMQSMHSASFVLMVKIMTSAKQKYRIFFIKWMR